MAKKLTVDPRTGLFRRDLGKKENGAQHRFYLGRDAARAEIAAQRLEDLWDAVKRSREALQLEPAWDNTTLSIAQAVARGDYICRVEVPDWLKVEGKDEGNNVIQDWLHDLREEYGKIIGLQLADENVAKEAEAAQARRAKATRTFGERLYESIGKGPTGETLHGAIDAYIAWNERKYLTAPEDGKEQRTSQTGKKQAERAARLKLHHKDCPLDRFGANELDAMVEYWANRPKMNDGSHYSFWTCKHQIRLIRHFFRWLHKNTDFVWRKPQDYEFEYARVLIHEQELEERKREEQVATFTRDEIATLWTYATPLERAMLLFGLNCGYGISEMATLRESQIVGEGKFIMRLRPKTKVNGCWKLWPVTLDAIAWCLERKKQLGVPSPLILTTENGTSYIDPTEKNNRGARLPNTWNRLIARIRKDKDHEAFRRLSIGKLRKTAADLIKRFSDGETASVFLCHGKTLKSDPLLENYTNRHWEKVYAAQDRVWEYLKDVFAGSFVCQDNVDSKISLGTIRRIHDLRHQGFTVKHIAKVLKVAESTVRSRLRNPS